MFCGPFFSTAVIASGLALSGCGNGMASAVVKSPHYSYRLFRPTPEVLLEKPTKPFTVVGTIQVRTSRPKTAPDLVEELKAKGIELGADAIIPPDPEYARNVKFESMNPYRAYYVFDDGRISVVEGKGIRFGATPAPDEPQSDPASR